MASLHHYFAAAFIAPLLTLELEMQVGSKNFSQLLKKMMVDIIFLRVIFFSLFCNWSSTCSKLPKSKNLSVMTQGEEEQFEQCQGVGQAFDSRGILSFLYCGPV